MVYFDGTKDPEKWPDGYGTNCPKCDRKGYYYTLDETIEERHIELFDRIRFDISTSTRVNGDAWSRHMDELAEFYKLEPDTRPGLYLSFS